jgi:hypothetical protein
MELIMVITITAMWGLFLMVFTNMIMGCVNMLVYKIEGVVHVAPSGLLFIISLFLTLWWYTC